MYIYIYIISYRSVYKFYKCHLLPLQYEIKTNVFIFTRLTHKKSNTREYGSYIYIILYEWKKVCFFINKTQHTTHTQKTNKVANKLWSCLQVSLHFLFLLYSAITRVHTKKYKTNINNIQISTNTHSHAKRIELFNGSAAW